nr:MAG TPA: hypothetical protein [Caudoviricetes sp.]
MTPQDTIIKNSKINFILTILMYNLKQTSQLPSPEQLSICILQFSN